MRFDAGSMAAVKQATGLSGDDEVSVLHPHIIGMRLQMALLTHPDYPLPIWHAVQIRNQLVRHRHIDPRQAYAMETAIGEHRVFDKGIEVDLLTRLLCGSDCCWESKITYYYRGHFGLTGTPRPKEESPDLAHAKLMVHLSMPSASATLPATTTAFTIGRGTRGYSAFVARSCIPSVPPGCAWRG